MGTDRDSVYEGPCSCGKGRYIINLCTPDHPFAKNDQYSYEFEISCPECSKRYVLEVKGYEAFRILRSEVEEKRKLKQLHYNKSEQVMEYAKQQGYLQTLKEKIAQLPTKASVYRALKPFLSMVYETEGTFRRHFADPGVWVDTNVFAHDMRGVMRFLGIRDKELIAMVDEMEELRKLSGQPVRVVEPAICKVPREGKTFLT